MDIGRKCHILSVNINHLEKYALLIAISSNSVYNYGLYSNKSPGVQSKNSHKAAIVSASYRLVLFVAQ